MWGTNHRSIKRGGGVMKEVAKALKKFVLRIAGKENATPAELEAMTGIACLLKDLTYLYGDED